MPRISASTLALICFVGVASSGCIQDPKDSDGGVDADVSDADTGDTLGQLDAGAGGNPGNLDAAGIGGHSGGNLDAGAQPDGSGGYTGGTDAGGPAPCSNDECGAPPPLPGMQCWDGSAAPTECARLDAQTCGWRVGQCPPEPDHCEDLSRDTILLGGALAFGECMHACQSMLTINATSLNSNPCDEVDLTVCGNTDQEQCTDHRGILTGNGHGRARTLARALDGVPLQESYDCPDCADGGESIIRLSLHGVESATRYESNKPPEVLLAADAYIQGLIPALRTCTSNADVDVAPDCVPVN